MSLSFSVESTLPYGVDAKRTGARAPALPSGGMRVFWSVAVVVGMPVCCQVGYWLGRHARRRPDGDAMSHTMNWQAAVLALGALLIGFTFSMATQRFEYRKKILLNEANAIGTAYLRTRVVDDPAGEDIRALMRQYIDRRIALYDVSDAASVAAVERASAVLQQQIWSQVMTAARGYQRPVMTGLLVTAVNEMIDVADERRAVRENPVPYTAFVVLVLVTGVAMVSIGYTCGVTGKKLLFGMLVMPLLTAAVVVLVYDLADVSSGLARPNNLALEHLKQDL